MFGFDKADAAVFTYGRQTGAATPYYTRTSFLCQLFLVSASTSPSLRLCGSQRRRSRSLLFTRWKLSKIERKSGMDGMGMFGISRYQYLGLSFTSDLVLVFAALVGLLVAWLRACAGLGSVACNVDLWVECIFTGEATGWRGWRIHWLKQTSPIRDNKV